MQLKTNGKIALWIAAFILAGIPVLSQTPQTPKPSFDVVSIKPNAPNPTGLRGGGARGNRYTMAGATLRMLLQQAYRPASEGPGQLQIINPPNWIDLDRYDIQATVDCSGGVISRDQLQLMIQSMLEDRYELKAHMETRELPIYNLVVGKDGPKLKASADQTPPALTAGGPPQPCGPAPERPSAPFPPPPPPPPPPGAAAGPPRPVNMPRGAMMVMINPSGMTMQATGVPIANLLGMLQQQVGRLVVDKTDLKGLFDFKLQFSPEGLNMPVPPGGFPPIPPGALPAGGAGVGAAGTISPPSAGDPIPSLFTAIQELGLKLESAKGPVNVLVIDSVQKPKEN